MLTTFFADRGEYEQHSVFFVTLAAPSSLALESFRDALRSWSNECAREAGCGALMLTEADPDQHEAHAHGIVLAPKRDRWALIDRWCELTGAKLGAHNIDLAAQFIRGQRGRDPARTSYRINLRRCLRYALGGEHFDPATLIDRATIAGALLAPLAGRTRDCWARPCPADDGRREGPEPRRESVSALRGVGAPAGAQTATRKALRRILPGQGPPAKAEPGVTAAARSRIMLAMAADPARRIEHNSPEAEAAYENAPEGVVAELLHGVVCMSPMPRPRHQRCAGRLCARLMRGYDREEGDGGPGDPLGWVFIPDATVHLGERPDKMRADLAGWRVDRARFDLDTAVITLAPDWVAEVLSHSTEKHDRGVKAPTLAEHGAEWVWFVDLDAQTVEAHRNERGALRLVRTARASDVAGLPPFERVSLAGLFRE